MSSLSQHYFQKRKTGLEVLQSSHSQPLIDDAGKFAPPLPPPNRETQNSDTAPKDLPYPVSEMTASKSLCDSALDSPSIRSLSTTPSGSCNCHRPLSCTPNESRLLLKIAKLTERKVEQALDRITPQLRLLEERTLSISQKLDACSSQGQFLYAFELMRQRDSDFQKKQSWLIFNLTFLSTLFKYSYQTFNYHTIQYNYRTI